MSPPPNAVEPNNEAPAKTPGFARPTNVLAAFLGAFLFLSAFGMLWWASSLQIDRIFPILTACCGLGLLFYAVGDEARIFNHSLNIAGASAISIIVFTIWYKSNLDESRYKAEAYALWKDPRVAAKIVDGPAENKPKSITIALNNRLIRGEAEENNQGNGYKFNLILNEKDVTDFMSTDCPFVRVTFNNGTKDSTHFAKLGRITPNDYNMFFIIKYYIDNKAVSVVRDKEVFLPACDSDKAAEAKDAAQIEKSENIGDQPTGGPAPAIPADKPIAKIESIPRSDKPASSADKISIPDKSPTPKIQTDEKTIIGYVLYSRFNRNKQKRDKNWFEIDSKPDAEFLAPNDIMRATEDDVPLRGFPFRWDEKTKKHLAPSAPFFRLKKDQKVQVAGDAIIATDENNGDQYSIVPVASVIGVTPPLAEVVARNYNQKDVKGYAYIGYVDASSGQVVGNFFDNITKPDAIYPGPNDVLAANRSLWLRAGPRRWISSKQDYENDAPIKPILKGQYIRLGGDVVLAKGGSSIWAPVSEIYERGLQEFAKKTD